LRECLDERQITLRIGALHHVVEIPDGLVRVNDERQPKLSQRVLQISAGVPLQSIANGKGDQSAETNRLHQKPVAYPFDSRTRVWNAGNRQLVRETAGGTEFHRPVRREVIPDGT
jgi:hypothetical protein